MLHLSDLGGWEVFPPLPSLLWRKAFLLPESINELLEDNLILKLDTAPNLNRIVEVIKWHKIPDQSMENAKDAMFFFQQGG